MEERTKIDAYLVEQVARAREARGENEKLRILEIGCGNGSLFAQLQPFGQVSGVDADQALVDEAKAGNPSIDVRCADYCSLPFDEEFDLALASGVFSLLADQIGLLKSVAQALVLNGLLVCQMGGQGSLACVQAGLAESLAKHSGGYSSQFCFPRETSYRRVLEISGFEVLDMRTVDTPLELPGGDDGLRLFAEKHFSGALNIYRPQDRELVIHDFESACRDELWNAEKQVWMIDLRELQFAAKKTRRVHQLGGSSQFTVLGA